MCIINEDSSILRYKRLCYISIEIIKKLVKIEVLNTLDFNDFETRADFINGKQTNK